MHGKHFEFMKKGMPLVLDPKTQNLLYEWIMEQKDTSDNIHFIKGDLHYNALFGTAVVLFIIIAALLLVANHVQNKYGIGAEGIE